MALFSLNRRSFVSGLAATAAAPPSIALADEPSVGIYMAESGKHGTWPRVLGALTVIRPAVHAAAIELLRRRAGYPRELRYVSTDRAKLGFARAAIDYFASQPDFRFTASIVHGEIAASFAFHAASPTGGKASNLVQLARFLAGCVHGSATAVRHPLKAGLIAYLDDSVNRLDASERTRRFTINTFRKNNTG
jgi:hypothetical protein